MLNKLKSLFGGTNPEPSIESGVSLFRRGQFDQALSVADQVLAAGPEIALSWRFRGECLEELERYPEALECFEMAHRLGGPGTEDLPNCIAMMQFCCGKTKLAAKTLKSVLNGDGSGDLKQPASDMLAEFAKH